MYEVRFSINISKKRYLEIYQSSVLQVVVKSHNGQHIQFPAKYLTDFVSPSGIRGNFRILYSQDNKFIRMEKI